jgi:hypothetical protein
MITKVTDQPVRPTHPEFLEKAAKEWGKVDNSGRLGISPAGTPTRVYSSIIPIGWAISHRQAFGLAPCVQRIGRAVIRVLLR